METIGAQPKLYDSTELNAVIQAYMVARAHQRNAEVDAFVNAPNQTDLIIMEVFKGLIASTKA